MSNEWEKMERAKEDRYYEEKDRQALERLSMKKGEVSRLSPVTGKPLRERALHGVVFDQCPDSKGIWLDAVELRLISEALSSDRGRIEAFFSAVLNNK